MNKNLKDLIERSCYVFEGESGWLKRYREKHDLTQRALSTILGISTPRIIAWEKGLRKPSPVIIEGIINVLSQENLYLPSAHS